MDEFQSVTRRSLAQLALIAVASMTACRKSRTGPTAVPPQSPPVVGPGEEAQSGDPGQPVEPLLIAQIPYRPEEEAAPLGPRKDGQAVALGMLGVASSLIGWSRSRTPGEVARLLRLFGLNLRYSDGRWVPFCAAGIGFSACRAYCQQSPAIPANSQYPDAILHDVLASVRQYYFRPSPSCAIMVDDARKRGTWISVQAIEPTSVKPGWLPFFDWYGDGTPHHVGIAEFADPLLHTVEFNTTNTAGSQANGGQVCRRIREWRYILGMIRTY